MKTYTTVLNKGYAEYEEKKSVFIGQCCHVTEEDEALSFIRTVKTENYEARHNVYAYVLDNGTVRCSDDGEPQGSAGVPTLDCIRKAGVTDTCVVVTRYFGGILLGTGGLLRAYTKAASLVVENAGIVTYSEYEIFKVRCSYTDYQKIRYELDKTMAVTDNTDYSDDVCITYAVKSEISAILNEKIIEITSGKSVPELTGKRFGA